MSCIFHNANTFRMTKSQMEIGTINRMKKRKIDET